MFGKFTIATLAACLILVAMAGEARVGSGDPTGEYSYDAGAIGAAR